MNIKGSEIKSASSQLQKNGQAVVSAERESSDKSDSDEVILEKYNDKPSKAESELIYLHQTLQSDNGNVRVYDLIGGCGSLLDMRPKNNSCELDGRLTERFWIDKEERDASKALTTSLLLGGLTASIAGGGFSFVCLEYCEKDSTAHATANGIAVGAGVLLGGVLIYYLVTCLSGSGPCAR